MIFKRILHILRALSVFTACSDDINVNPPQLVVEGWIDAGGFPRVYLTTTLPITEDRQDFEEINNHILKWAKVTLSDGEKEIILNGRADNNQEPPFLYTTTDMRGETGKTYTLKVDYKQYHATAVTTIPAVARLKNLYVATCDVPGKYTLKATLDDPKDERNFYKLFVRTLPEETYYLSFYPSTFHDEMPEIQQPLTIAPGTKSEAEEYSPYFNARDVVLVKVANLEETGYLFWKDFEELITSSRNPIFSIHKNIHSNINGGMGYWCGYGASEYLVNIADSLLQGRVRAEEHR